jgi:hypothetical protein
VNREAAEHCESNGGCKTDQRGLMRNSASAVLAALALHETQRDRTDPNVDIAVDHPANNSSALWSTLRRAFDGMVSALDSFQHASRMVDLSQTSSSQDRPDLVEKAVVGTDLEFFKRQGFEF